MRRVPAFLFFLLMLAVYPLSAEEVPTTTDTRTTESSSTTESTAPSVENSVLHKTLSVRFSGGVGQILSDTQTHMFWEYPQLSGGGQHLPGTLTVRNDTAQSVHIYLDSIVLPYQNEAALDYLSALQLTVRENGEILYQGSYSGVNDAGGLRTDYILESGQQRVWEIEMYCPFSYGGDPQQVSEPCTWKFRATAMTRQTGSSVVDDEGRQEQVRIMLIGAGVVLLACIVAAIWYYRRSRSV